MASLYRGGSIKLPSIPANAGYSKNPRFLAGAKPKAKKDKESNQPLWMDIIDAISVPGRMITTPIANITDNKADTTFFGGMRDAALMRPEGKKGFADIFNNLGWKQNEKTGLYDFFKGQKGKFDLFDIASFAGDVATDPLTYVSFGVGGVAKAGLSAMGRAAVESAARSGVNVSRRQWRQASDLVYRNTYDRAISSGRSTTAADALATRARQATQRDIENAGRSARETAQNQMFHINAPFINRQLSFGQKPNFMRIVDERIGELGGTGIRNTLDRIMSPTVAANFLNRAYGVRNADDLTIQMKDDLLRRLAESTTSGRPPRIDRFVADAGGISTLGRMFDRVNLFNPRSLRSRNQFVNQAGEMTTEAGNRVIGRRRLLDRLVQDLRQLVRGFDQEELRAITYLIEDAFPRGMTRSAYLATLPDAARVLAVLPEFQRVIDDITREELRSGVLRTPIANYFPHVVTNRYNIDRLEELRALYGADPDIGRFIGRTSTSRFNRSRTSFQNLAQLTDALERLYAIRASGVLPAHIPSMTDLERRIELLENLFERTPVEAIGKRYYASIRSVAMRDLQNELANSGLIVYADDVRRGLASPQQRREYIRVDNRISNQLGIERNSLIHPEVYQGLQNTYELFTDQGLQRFLNNFQNVTNIWKTFTTSFLPSHYWFNFVGNTMANAMVGVKPSSYTRAVRLLNAHRTGTLTAEEERLINYAYETGVLGQTSSADLRILTEDPRTTPLQRIDDFAQLLASPLRRTLGDAPDHMFRLAHFLHILDNTASQTMAATSVRKHLFNYNELTAADKVLKTVIPFWNWTKNNLPLQITMLLRQPRYAQNYERIRQQTLGDTKEDENAPDWLLQNYMKVGKNEFYNPRVPIADMGTLTDLDKILGMQHPLLKIPQELAANRQYFNAKPIDYGKESVSEIDPAKLQEYLLKQTGLTSRFASALEGFGNTEDSKNVADNIRDLLIGKTTSIQPKKTTKKEKASLSR